MRIIKKKINSEYFIQEILKKHFVIWNGFQKGSPKQLILQQDNAPIHGSTVSVSQLRTEFFFMLGFAPLDEKHINR